MGAVHGRSGVTKAEKPPSSQDGGPALQELWRCPTVMSPLSAASDGLLITEMASLGPPLLGATLLTALYTRMATTTLSSSRFGVSVTLRRTQSPCALCHGDRAGFPEKETPRG